MVTGMAIKAAPAAILKGNGHGSKRVPKMNGMMKADEAVPVPIVISHIEYRSHSGPVTP